MKKIATLAAALSLTTTLAGAGIVVAQAPPQEPPIERPAPRTGQAPLRGERHPEMRKAIAQLERTKALLQEKAASDFGGHKAQAIQLIDQAISQLREGIRSDRQ